MNIAYIPSPPINEIHIGPFPLRAYAVFIIIGVFVAIWMGERRWVARGGRRGTVSDIAVWAVPFGLVGGRLYNIVTTPWPYFGPHGNPWQAFEVWKGGLGIWGAIALGGVGAWIACRRRGIPLPALADALAPGIVLAQAIGRWGNYFNQELFGRPTTLPWGLEIAPAHRPVGYTQFATFHPTFLYESIWDAGVAVLVIWADRKFRLGHGRAFALYVAAYTAGRGWVESLRIDKAEHYFGLRLNDWMSLLVFTGAVVYLILSAKLRPGRELVVEPVPAAPDTDVPAEDDEAQGQASAAVPANGAVSAEHEAGREDTGPPEQRA